eukprot:4928876-Amphidinium_carterae.1
MFAITRAGIFIAAAPYSFALFPWLLVAWRLLNSLHAVSHVQQVGSFGRGYDNDVSDEHEKDIFKNMKEASDKEAEENQQELESRLRTECTAKIRELKAVALYIQSWNDVAV